jgi:hypothetical protein
MRAVIRHSELAAVIAAVIASVVLQVGSAIHVGYLDPFWPFAFGGGAIIAWIVATIVIYFIDHRRG